MRSPTKTILLLFAILTIAFVSAMAVLRDQEQTASPGENQKEIAKREFESQLPIADYSAPDLADPAKRAKREAKSKKYDKSDMSVSASGDATSSFIDWATGLPALPVEQSSAVIIGTVVDAKAYLSNDKTGVYSEFDVRIQEVLKNSSVTSLVAGKDIIVERPGGRVRFPSGHINQYFIVGQGMPRVGRRYVLFLTGGEQDFQILTGYEVREDRIFLLDNPGSGHPITAYKGVDEPLFFNDLRALLN